MLSATNTVSDVKTKLENDYSYFSYASDDLFTLGIENVCEDVVRLYFYPRIGKIEYDRVALLDKVGLTELEENLYWAEVYTVCVEFLRSRSARTGQLQTSANESLSVEGYRYQVGSGAGSSLGDDALKYYRGKMFMYWKLVGYNVMSLERTCSIFGETPEAYNLAANSE